MAHFAQLNENNVVTNVTIVSNEDIRDVNGVEVEEIGIALCKKHFGADTRWLQTSYNNNIRVRYAGIDYTYDEQLDAFIPPKPFDSWILNEDIIDWESPVGPAPELTDPFSFYRWDEELGNWVLETVTPEPEELEDSV